MRKTVKRRVSLAVRSDMMPAAMRTTTNIIAVWMVKNAKYSPGRNRSCAMRSPT
ncbi:unannotated protein [freshwater metagenome]|uniref:Unannotated protein n=1 Tax=freshwater metagenome TaxID=449393 RepID=A0A6J7FWL3_9ZZZZ